MDAIKVSMITLVTPVTALLLGALFNNEPLSISILMGALLVVLGLTVFEFDKDMHRLITRCLSRQNCASK